MKRMVGIALVIIGLVAVTLYAQEKPKEAKPKTCLFLTSLHHTAKGMEYWYSKEQGGLERLTGVPYSELACRNCHVAECDRCHREQSGDKQQNPRAAYTVKASRNQQMCLQCHGREQAMMKINEKLHQEDVHLQNGMQCVDCHSAEEMHGNGIEYTSMKQQGAMTTQCENCHESVEPTQAHTVHAGKLDCKACHLGHVVSCMNCHFDTMVKDGVRKAIPASGWLFLMNYEGKVTSANTQTFVSQGKTFLMFAPHMSHAVMKEGRKCEDCHGTETMKQAKEGKVKLTWLENGGTGNLKGVIPVVDSAEYECSYQDMKEGKWVPIGNPPKPLRHYVAYGEPLTSEQLEHLLTTQKSGPPKDLSFRSK